MHCQQFSFVQVSFLAEASYSARIPPPCLFSRVDAVGITAFALSFIGHVDAGLRLGLDRNIRSLTNNLFVACYFIGVLLAHVGVLLLLRVGAYWSASLS